ncbi:MAG: 1-acyl-sn-glycerol-3-phosphate acyltransferase [Pseudomonadota bacterium]|nr:1-acyl-sn-glycerol-3-phosphate acyltransferase [Pseudomonadota bacterium]
MNRLRTIVFSLVFYGISAPIVIAALFAALFGRRATIAYALWWTRFHRWATRSILDIHWRVEGNPFPPGPVLYAAKHQAMYETLELGDVLGGPVIVMKQELAGIPFWGWAARRYGVIIVDRAASAGALRRMLREGRAAIEEGRSILIFPEGTRVLPGEQPPLRAGFAGLYQLLKLPVVPIALDSGAVWPRGEAKRPGIVTFRFGKPIPPGLPRAEAEALVHAAINALDTPAAAT